MNNRLVNYLNPGTEIETDQVEVIIPNPILIIEVGVRC